MEKQCKKCLRTKPLDEFYKHPMMADCHLSKCKECARADVTENRNANADYYKNYDRKRYDEGGRRGEASAAAIARASAKWVAAHKFERRAQAVVANAIRSGRIVRPDTCSKCGATGKIDAHHEDYSKPLDVTWVCKKCHGETWTKERKKLKPRKRGGYKGSMVASRAE
jgi:ribosomal protein S27AE